MIRFFNVDSNVFDGLAVWWFNINMSYYDRVFSLILHLFQNARSNRSQDTPTKVSSILRNKQASTVPQSDATSIAAYPPPTALIRKEAKSVNLDSQSPYSASTSRFLRVSTNPSVSSSTTGSTSRGIPVSKLDDVLAQTQDDFLLVQPSDLDDKIYLFTRTCREKETWFRRLYGASIGKPLLLTTQQVIGRANKLYNFSTRGNFQTHEVKAL